MVIVIGGVNYFGCGYS